MGPASLLLDAAVLESEGMDLGGVLDFSPLFHPLGAFAPASSQRSYSASISSESACHSQPDDMAFPNDESAVPGFYYPATSDTTNYHHGSSISTQQTYLYSLADTLSNYNEQSWTSLPLHPQQSLTSFVTDAPPSSIFQTFETPLISSGASFVPPAPQSPFSLSKIALYGQNSPYFTSQPSSSRFDRRPSESQSISSISRSPTPSQLPLQSFSSPYSSPPHCPASSNSPSLLSYGIPVSQGDITLPTWRCAYPGCTSRALFTRGCDLRKHFNRHSKHLFCRVEGCPQSAAASALASALTYSERRRSSCYLGGGGFSSKKDRARHEAKHNPDIRCGWRGPEGEDCGRVFSRMDNMKDHVRRIHGKAGQ
jgi:hypothetical protein